MVKLVELECPNCGGRMKKSGKTTAKCPHCDAEFLIDDEQPDTVINIYNEPESKKNSTNAIAILFIFIAILAVLIILLVISVSQSDGTDGQKEMPGGVSQGKQNVESETPQGLKSAFYQQLVTAIYGKPYTEVSDAELREITSLSIYATEENLVAEYSRNDGSVQKVSLAPDTPKNNKDLSNFKGLKKIKVYSSLDREHVAGLEELTEIWSYNTLSELIEIVDDPAKITGLYVSRDDDLSKLAAFPNLEKLELYAYSITNIDKLAELKNLKSLIITAGDNILSWNVLHTMSKLEVLEIDSESLKNISFVEQMDHLRELSLIGTDVIQVAPLKGKVGLKKLVLDNNYEMIDYTSLSTLSGLEELVLDLNESEYMPDVSAWTNLKSLEISGIADAGFLRHLTNLEHLSIAGVYCETLGAMENLQKLESLEIAKVSGDLEQLSNLSVLKSLKKLDIHMMDVYGNVDAFFQISSLEEININDCSFGLNLDTIPENTNLKILRMNRVKFWENIYVQYDGMITMVDYDNINLPEKMDFLGKFPNLEEVYLQGNKLSDVTFAESLPKLRVLDITNNYVTDLRPLGGLEELETVLCGSNPVSQGLDLGEDVWVNVNSVTEEKPLWR